MRQKEKWLYVRRTLTVQQLLKLVWRFSNANKQQEKSTVQRDLAVPSLVRTETQLLGEGLQIHAFNCTTHKSQQTRLHGTDNEM